MIWTAEKRKSHRHLTLYSIYLTCESDLCSYFGGKDAMLRIPGKATTLSGAWRPRDPVDDDRGGARA
jgi:hypothetical protein